MIDFNILQEREICYDLEGFKPLDVDASLLKKLGITYPISEEVNKELIEGTQWYKGLYDNKALTPAKAYVEVEVDENEELEIHNYTGICPTNVLEISPSGGSCSVGCQYCLVTDGKHIKGIEVYKNYPAKLANSLLRNKDRAIFYYFSPKTEAFSEPHLFNGLAHKIILTFVDHFEKYPESKVRIFIATKGGPLQFGVTYKGKSLYDLLELIADKVQVNGSIGIMPQYLRDILEPNAASISQRLESLVECRERGMWAESVLCQPLILPFLTEETTSDYMQQLAKAGIKNIKPEFFTAEVKNLVLVAQYINHFKPEKLGEFFTPYLSAENLDHIKQRSRIAPNRQVSAEKLGMINRLAKENGISISICNWVKKEISAVEGWVKNIDKESANDGYRCLGYQTKLFSK